MTAADRIKKLYRLQVLKSGNGFSETGTFTPRGGEGRSLTVSITAEGSVNESEATRDEWERITIFCLRDEADALGGVETLVTGDQYARPSTHDTDSTPYVFNGSIIEKGQHYYRAVFQRYRSTSRGRGAGL